MSFKQKAPTGFYRSIKLEDLGVVRGRTEPFDIVCFYPQVTPAVGSYFWVDELHRNEPGRNELAAPEFIDGGALAHAEAKYGLDCYQSRAVVKVLAVSKPSMNFAELTPELLANSPWTLKEWQDELLRLRIVTKNKQPQPYGHDDIVRWFLVTISLIAEGGPGTAVKWARDNYRVVAVQNQWAFNGERGAYVPDTHKERRPHHTRNLNREIDLAIIKLSADLAVPGLSDVQVKAIKEQIDYFKGLLK